ncbi:hypothetical protein [Neobacillus sp. PS2-9]|uniref:hypothetical protein n=1 Tax=Neobacillus sp. PS2-9 TaxID=3070676 RepID=UPI0027E0AC23|nr:hypothetical protein [Neobacillus sp. PS2-9]WML57727.1 hypothetical protein RCG25_22950 [Neobacillus sp. PS2-9]
MKLDVAEMTRSKKEILEEIKKPVIILILTAFTFIIIISAVNGFGRQLYSDFIGALINLFFAWNVGFGLYKGIWQFSNSRKINKVLFPKLEQFINDSQENSYDDTEAEVYEKVKAAYSKYTEKYNKLNKIYWISFKISFAIPVIAIIIWFIYSY